jgi:hypothetical protein
MPKSGAAMKHLQPILSIAVGLALSAAAAHAAPPETGGPAHDDWIVVDARNHANGAKFPVAMVRGVADERGQRRPASLRVDGREGRTIVRVDTDGLAFGRATIEVRQSLDGGGFVAGAWLADADGSVLTLSGDEAIAFLAELSGRSELRLAVVRPLSVPFVLTFRIGGAERALRLLTDPYRWSGGPAISEAEP